MQNIDDKLIYLFESEANKLKINVHQDIESLKDYKLNLDKVNWDKLVNHFKIKFEALYKTFGLNKVQSGIAANKINLERYLNGQLREKIVYHLITSTKKNNSTKELLLSIDEMFKVYQYQHAIESMNIYQLKKIADKFTGKKISGESLELYKNIFIKNDEYIEKDGEGNFSKATRIVLKNASDWRNKFKAFNKFQNSKDLHTFKDFQNYLSTIRK